MGSSRWARRPWRQSRPRLCAKTSRTLRSSPHALGSQCPSTPGISPGSTDATPLSTDNSSSMTRNGGTVAGRPKIGLLGIMQSLYDEMLPGIAERQAGYAGEVAAALGEVADVRVAGPAKEREDAERAMRELAGQDLDGLLVVNLTYGPAMRVARLLAETPLPVCLANIQPVPAVTGDWDMADLTYNQGIHGAQDTANAMVRAGRSFHVITDDWRADSFREAIARWARAAAAVTGWRSLKVAVFGYAMNGMGDIRVDEHALRRTLGPQVDALAPGELHRAAAAIAEDGRFARLPLAAASSLMAAGFGFGAEGDALTAALMAAGQTMLGDTQFT